MSYLIVNKREFVDCISFCRQGTKFHQSLILKDNLSVTLSLRVFVAFLFI